MATNLHIDGALLAEAVKVGGGKSKRETVNEALSEYVNRRAQLKVIDVFGTLDDADFWESPSGSGQGRSKRYNGKKQ